jgi:hypothetical protein
MPEIRTSRSVGCDVRNHKGATMIVKVLKDQPNWDTGGCFAVAGEIIEIVQDEGESWAVKKQNGGRFTIWKRDVEVIND